MSRPDVTDFDENTEPEPGTVRALARQRGISVAHARRLYGLSPEPPRSPAPDRTRSFLMVDTLMPFRHDGWYWLKVTARTALRLDPTAHAARRIHLREEPFEFEASVEPVALATLPAPLQQIVRRRRARTLHHPGPR